MTLQDTGWNRIKIAIQTMDKKKVEIGLLDNKNNIATIGFFNEFGTRHIPERSFIRTTVKINKDDFLSLARDRIKKLILGSITSDKILQDSGQYWEYKIMKAIKDFSSPANAPSTIRQKGFNNPLIHHSLMLASIKYKVK